MNRSKKPKIHKKTKVKKLQEEVREWKSKLSRAAHAARITIGDLQVRLAASERMAAGARRTVENLQMQLAASERTARDARPSIRWDTLPAVDACTAIRTGKAKRFVVVRDVEDIYGQDYVEHVKATINYDIAKAIQAAVPVVTQKDRRGRVTRFSVDFYVLFVE